MVGMSGVGREQAWEVTTLHGTRILLDPGEEARWMRIPAISDDGRLNLHELDGRWRRLLTAYPLDEHHRQGLGEFGIEVGKRLRIHVGIHEWWDTTTVVAVRPIRRDELPGPLPANPDDDS